MNADRRCRYCAVRCPDLGVDRTCPACAERLGDIRRPMPRLISVRGTGVRRNPNTARNLNARFKRES